MLQLPNSGFCAFDYPPMFGPVAHGYAKDLGLVSEECHPDAKRLTGNFSQVSSHLALIRAPDPLRATAENGG